VPFETGEVLMTGIKEPIENVIRYLTEHPDEARYTDSFARATLGEALRVKVEGPDGLRIATDMPSAIGGLETEPSPGWLYRAAIASCVASTIGMEAAREGVDLRSLQVEVDSESDDRGILGMDESVPAGQLSTRVRVRIEADGEEARLRELVERGASRCPSYDATRRAVDVSLEIERG
jgi:uncharacterized OsmC-like protein